MLKNVSFLSNHSILRQASISIKLSVWRLATDTVGCLIFIFSSTYLSSKVHQLWEVELLPTEYSFSPSADLNFCHKSIVIIQWIKACLWSNPFSFQLVDFHFKRKTQAMPSDSHSMKFLLTMGDYDWAAIIHLWSNLYSSCVILSFIKNNSNRKLF